MRVAREVEHNQATIMERALVPKTRTLTGARAQISIGGKVLHDLHDLNVALEAGTTQHFEPHTIGTVTFSEQELKDLSDDERDAHTMEAALTPKMSLVPEDLSPVMKQVTFRNVALVFKK